MEYSLDNKVTWIKYNGSNAPDLTDANKTVYVRTAGTASLDASDSVALVFTGNVAPSANTTLDTIWIIVDTKSTEGHIFFSCINITREDGTIIAGPEAKSPAKRTVGNPSGNIIQYSMGNDSNVARIVGGTSTSYNFNCNTGRYVGVAIGFQKTETVKSITFKMKGYERWQQADVYIRKINKDITAVTSANGIGEYSEIASSMGVDVLSSVYVDCTITF